MLVCIGESALLPVTEKPLLQLHFKCLFLNDLISKWSNCNYDFLSYYDFFFNSEAEKTLENG